MPSLKDLSSDDLLTFASFLQMRRGEMNQKRESIMKYYDWHRGPDRNEVSRLTSLSEGLADLEREVVELAVTARTEGR